MVFLPPRTRRSPLAKCCQPAAVEAARGRRRSGVPLGPGRCEVSATLNRPTSPLTTAQSPRGPKPAQEAQVPSLNPLGQFARGQNQRQSVERTFEIIEHALLLLRSRVWRAYGH